jgi:hypothetical protein
MSTSLRYAIALLLVPCMVAFAQTTPPPPVEPSSQDMANNPPPPPPPEDTSAPAPDANASEPQPPADTTALVPPPPADAFAAAPQSDFNAPPAPAPQTVASNNWHPVPDRRWHLEPQVITASGEAMMVRPGYHPLDHRPDLEIKGRVQGADLVLTFPDTTLPRSISFKVPGKLNVTPHRLAASDAIRWNSATELLVNMDLFRNRGSDLSNLWVWGQLKEGAALMQRVHVQQ